MNDHDMLGPLLPLIPMIIAICCKTFFITTAHLKYVGSRKFTHSHSPSRQLLESVNLSYS